MFQHTLLLAYRSFLRFKSTFFINLIGLSTGLACALFIYLWVNDELAVDKFHEKDSRLYQVMQNIPNGDGSIITAPSTPGLLGKALRKEIPEVEDALIIAGGSNRMKGILTIANNHLKASELYVPQNFFNFFSFKLLHGNKADVLANKASVVLSDELALKLFRTTENVIGKMVEWEQGDFTGTYIISGIFQKPSSNSSLQFDLLFSYSAYYAKEAAGLQDWQSSYIRTYLLLKEGAKVEAVQAKIKNYLSTKNKEFTAAWLKIMFALSVLKLREKGRPATNCIPSV